MELSQQHQPTLSLAIVDARGVEVSWKSWDTGAECLPEPLWAMGMADIKWEQPIII